MPRMPDSPLARYAADFPPTHLANPDGLLCAGGDLDANRLLAAYSLGIFPCFTGDGPILWWSPDPRCVMPLDDFRVSRRSLRSIGKKGFSFSLDRAFGRVISACSAARPKSGGVWIVPSMIRAYCRLHELGYAHSVEVWQDGRLVGGLYGVALGAAFFGESMFHTVSEASRAALMALVSLLRARGATLLDCQQESPHMMRMGARLLGREDFESLLASSLGRHGYARTGFCPGQDIPPPFDFLPWPRWKKYRWADGAGSWQLMPEASHAQPDCAMRRQESLPEMENG